MNDFYDDNDGGFTQPDNNMSTQQTPSKKSAKKFSDDTKQITPVTIRQLLNARMTNDDFFQIDNNQVGTVTFVGKVVSIVEKTQLTSFMIDDSTGIIETKVWLTRDYVKARKHEWQQGKYIRVYGHLSQSYDAKNTVNATHCALVNDFNEITFHHLDVIHAHLYNSKGSLPTVNPREWEQEMERKRNGEQGTSGSTQQENFSTYPSTTTTNSNYADKFQEHFNSEGKTEYAEVRDAVLKVIKSNTSKNGIHIREVYDLLGHLYTDDDICEAINELGGGGQIYNGSDNDHLKSAV